MCVNISSIKRIFSNQSHYFPDIPCMPVLIPATVQWTWVLGFHIQCVHGPVLWRGGMRIFELSTAHLGPQQCYRYPYKQIYPCAWHECVWGSRLTTPFILKFGNRWRWMVSLTSRPHYPPVKDIPLNRRLGVNPESFWTRWRRDRFRRLSNRDFCNVQTGA